ncbi:ferrochelatase [Orrella sp. NBD-18]|uniref:Ferrochelatase n=1 Tax=Sheuella amnicola TaxID=2707330 RepID=A0A6B2QYU7_9BURK|nr:ferrochelatase [Sheuella amnicola]NDY82878.1 ferrochelatase [Sheuella amnicola]HBI84034.1 ferrochelatase [Alcaligenaceae bacterium]
MKFWPEPTHLRTASFVAWPEIKQVGRVGVVLVNLGTPDAPTAGAIRRYLREFLSDPRVIEIPRLLWWPILNGPILTFRPRKLAHRYQSIWMEGGSPLMVYTQRQTEGLREVFASRGMDVEVETGMRYGNPSIKSAMLKLRGKGCEQILIVPLYPQYAASTTATVVDEVMRVASHMRNQPALRFIKRFNTDPSFIRPLGEKIAAFWLQNGRPQKLVMSFHGLPKMVVDQGDPYCKDCYGTAAALARFLQLKDDDYIVTFQSRFGPAKWLEPYTEPTLQRLAGEGVTDVDVVCPGFLADCLETLEEIRIEVRDAFLAAGGRQFRYISALNDDPAWIHSLADLVQSQLQGWPTTA